MVGQGKEPLLSSQNIISLLGALLMSAAALALFSQVEFLRSMGYPGVFLISLISSATVLLPLPGFAVVFAMGAQLNPALVGLAAGVGSALGETSGYLAGFAGHAALGTSKHYRAHKKQVIRYGPLIIFALSFIPNPVFDLAGMAAGATRMPYWQFLIATAAGKTLRYAFVAYAGGIAGGFF